MKSIFTLFLSICLCFSASSQTASVQFIHNSADMDLDTVDIYLDGSLWQDDFAFHQSTAFLDLSAGDHQWSIAAMNSTGPEFSFLTQTISLAASSTNILVLNGCTNPGTYFPFQPLEIHAFGSALETGTSGAGTDILFYQGVTDASLMDLQETDLIQLTAFEDQSYGSFQGYLNLPGANYVFALSDASGQEVYASFNAPLSDLGFGGDAVTIISSGFLNQAYNNGGQSLGLWLASASGGALIPLTIIDWNLHASMQIIHNSADAALDVVDVYLNDELIADDLAFRHATPFIDLPGGQSIQIGFAPSGSTGSGDIIYSQNFDLLSGQAYVSVADGIYSASGYNPALPFGLYTQVASFTAAPIPSDVMMVFTHGITDAGLVDLSESDLWNTPLINGLGYSEFSSYFSMPADDYEFTLSFTDGGTLIEEYEAPLASLGLAGQALVIVASGFISPLDNSDGPFAGLWLALSEGGALIPLQPVAEPPVFARIQFIHNSADAQFAEVDVYVNDVLTFDNFAFRSASAYMDILAGGPQEVGIAPADSDSPDDVLVSFNPAIAEGETYLAVVSGAVSPGYNPSYPIALHVMEGVREEALNSGDADILVFNGATDLTSADVQVFDPQSFTLANDLSYSGFQAYSSFTASDDLGIALTNASGSVTVGNYTLPLAANNLSGQSIVLFASGFLNPANNNDGEDVWIWAALADGSTFALPVYVSVSELFSESGLSAFPNPTHGVMNFKGILNEMNPLRLQVVNTDNKVVFERRFTPSSRLINEILDLSSLSNGQYTLLVSDGRNTETFRFTLLR